MLISPFIYSIKGKVKNKKSIFSTVNLRVRFKFFVFIKLSYWLIGKNSVMFFLRIISPSA
jgi:hypothetical protein